VVSYGSMQICHQRGRNDPYLAKGNQWWPSSHIFGLCAHMYASLGVGSDRSLVSLLRLEPGSVVESWRGWAELYLCGGWRAR